MITLRSFLSLTKSELLRYIVDRIKQCPHIPFPCPPFASSLLLQIDPKSLYFGLEKSIIKKSVKSRISEVRVAVWDLHPSIGCCIELWRYDPQDSFSVKIGEILVTNDGKAIFIRDSRHIYYESLEQLIVIEPI